MLKRKYNCLKIQLVGGVKTVHRHSHRCSKRQEHNERRETVGCLAASRMARRGLWTLVMVRSCGRGFWYVLIIVNLT